MTQKLEKVAGWFLILIALATMYLTIWDFDWKCEGLSFVFMITYIFSGVMGVTLLLDAGHNLPEEFYREEA